MPTTAEQLAILVANTDGMLTTVTAVKDSFTASKDTAVAAAVDATTQAGIATTQAGISTGKATEALSSANASAASAASAAEIVNISSVTTFTNPLSRAVQIRTSSSSERGIQQLSSSRIDSASLPCGETVALALIDYTPSGIVKLSNKHNGSVGVIFELLTTGFLRLTLNATTYTSTVAVSVVDGDFTVFDWSYFIPAASSAGGIVFAVNGVQIGTTVSVTAGTPINTTNVANKFVLGTSSVSESAVFLYYKLWKSHRTPAEILSTLVNGTQIADSARSGIGATLTGSNKWSGIAAGADGKLYCGPYDATDILIIDPVAGTATRSAMGATLTGSAKWNGIAAGADGKLYCAPFNATDILIIDPVAGTASRSAMGATLTGTFKWNGIAAGADGKLYCATRSATDILIIDPVAGTATRSAMGATLTGSNKWTSIAAGADGKLYCGPYEATDILIIKNLIASSLSAEDCQSDTGQILDRANNNHALMPASGATVYPQNLRPEIRGKNTWAATSELQYVSGVNQALYSASHYFEGIIVVPSAATTTGFTVGNGANASYYATVPGPLVAGDPIYIPLANRFSDGINRKLTITPMAAWTVSLNVTALGHVLEIS